MRTTCCLQAGVRPPCPSSTRRGKSLARHCIGLAALSAIGAQAQTPIGPGLISNSVILDAQDAIVASGTTIDVPAAPGAGWALVARNGSRVVFDTSQGPIQLLTRTAQGQALRVEQNAVVETAAGASPSGGLTIGTSANGEYGVGVFSGGRVALSGATITTAGAAAGDLRAHGVFVQGAGSTAALTGGSITTTGDGTGAMAVGGGALTLTDVAVAARQAGANRSFGINAQSGAGITVNGGSIVTEGPASSAVRASGMAGPGSRIVLADTSVATAGNNAHGALATSGGARIDAERVALDIGGGDAAGWFAAFTGRLVATDSTVATGGTNGYGAYARASGGIALLRGAVTTTGERAVGLFVGDTDTTLSATEVAVSTAGADAPAAAVFGAGALAMVRGSVRTAGDGSHGVSAIEAGSTASIDGTTVSTEGGGAHAFAVYQGAALTGTGVDAEASGADASALLLTGLAGTHSRADFTSGSRLSSVSGPAIAVAGGTATVGLADATVTGGTLWLRVGPNDAFSAAARRFLQPPGPQGENEAPSNPVATERDLAMATATPIVSTGAEPGFGTIVASNSRIAGAALTEAGSVSDVTLRHGTHWNMTGNSNLTRLTVDASQVMFAPPVAGTFKTLTVQQYTGVGGLIALNTRLDGDDSPSDRLVVQGSAGGQSRLRIVNAGGAGALTSANGIQVVEATSGATTTADAFALDGRVVAGAYEYRLFHGSVDPSSPQSWYLRSERQPAPPGPPQPPQPLFRPEAAAYLANRRVAGEMFVHSLHDRLGEPQFVEAQGFAPDSQQPRSGWLRMVGKWEGSHSRDGNFQVDTDTFLLQGGAELAKWSLLGAADRVHLGVMGSYLAATTDAQAAGNPARARGKVDGFSAGVYGTWYQNDDNKLGAYVDTWFQYGWFDQRVEGAGLPTVKYDAHGLAVSGEVGYAIPLRADWVIEPQAQLVYVDYRQDDIAEANGTRIAGGDSDGPITRLGVRLHRTFVQGDTRRIQPYLTLNWWHADTDRRMTFDRVTVGDLYPENRYEAKLGVNAQLHKRWTGWANLAGAWGEQSYHQYVVRVGVKYTW
ncbi:autotransporter family protein [Cupriavidus gilardii]|uniref:autotransporter family protein n=1 Tax=Cupriavidus gilardii TaxID=82541 RepID=UPI0015719423|nr:autotransporter outer membrane beta-barrel domain-containing protein [Cupriavidus gilardii]NSX06855.1 autotransporter outer membrane beta-barrel domain-containing protein [Cupriavidus gilardii]